MRVCFILSASLLILSCKGKPANLPVSATADTTQFFNVTQYIQQQISEVSKTPYFIYKKTVKDRKTDSVAVTNQQFAELAKQFMEPDINGAPLKKEYTENAFFDQTTKTYTLNYSTKNRTLEVQSMDVLLLEDGQTLKRIFVRKYINYNNDSTAFEQLSWKPNEQFQVSRMVQKPGKSESASQTVVVWNDKN